MIDWTTALAKLVSFLELATIGALGGIASYVRISITKGKPFIWPVFFGTIFLASFVAMLSGQFIDPGPYRDGYLMALGFCAYPVLEILETKVIALVDKFKPGA